jgi:hypothetical protein
MGSDEKTFRKNRFFLRKSGRNPAGPKIGTARNTAGKRRKSIILCRKKQHGFVTGV